MSLKPYCSELILVDYVRLLIYGRILEPASELATVHENEEFYTPVVPEDPYFYHVYDTPNLEKVSVKESRLQ